MHAVLAPPLELSVWIDIERAHVPHLLALDALHHLLLHDLQCAIGMTEDMRLLLGLYARKECCTKTPT